MHQSKVRIVGDGIFAGLIGGAVIAAWFWLFDAINGDPLYSPALLAAASMRLYTTVLGSSASLAFCAA